MQKGSERIEKNRVRLFWTPSIEADVAMAKEWPPCKHMEPEINQKR